MRPHTKEWVIGALNAVRATIDKYENAYSITCPLCSFDMLCGAGTCSVCPWTVFKKQHCDDANYNRDPISLRLRRLRGWEKRLMNILKKKRSEK